MQRTEPPINTLLLDIDGVIKNKGILVPGTGDLLRNLTEKGINIKFVTNCSLHKLNKLDEKISPGLKFEILDPIDVLVNMIDIHPELYQCSAMVIGTKEIRHRLSEAGIKLTTPNKVDAVFIFEKLNYDQDELVYASRLVLNGARLYCAGLDRFFWYKGDVYPGVGAIVKQISYMTQSDAIVLGKPSKLIFELALGQNFDLKSTLFVGDDLQTDILGAKQCGILTAYLATTSSPNINNSNLADKVDIDFKSLVEKIF